MRVCWLLVSCAIVGVVGCNSGVRDPASPSNDGCDPKNVGPLVGYTYDPGPAPPAVGGAIPDGIYDLTQIVEHGRSSGEWSSNNAPALRWAIRFATEERSPNHTEGRIAMTVAIPPASQCDVGRFATIETELRTQSKAHPELEAIHFSATPDGVMLQSKGTTYVFHRR